MSKGKYYFSKSVEKGLSVLELFTKETPSMTQSQVSKILDLNMTSTYRYINTLVELGYLDKDPKTKRITLSAQCQALCLNLLQATDNLRLIKKVVDRLVDRHNISIDVAHAVDNTLVRMYHREAEEVLTYSLPEFSRNCLHNTALGKAYLMTLSNNKLADKIDSMTLVAKTDRTITIKADLIGEIEKSKTRGYALQEEEYIKGVLAIAAPLYDPIQEEGIGAVSFDFSVLEHNPQSIVEQYGELIQETAEELSKLLPPGKYDESH